MRMKIFGIFRLIFHLTDLTFTNYNKFKNNKMKQILPYVDENISEDIPTEITKLLPLTFYSPYNMCLWFDQCRFNYLEDIGL